MKYKTYNNCFNLAPTAQVKQTLRSTVVVLSQRYAVSIPRMYALLRSRGEERTLEYLGHRAYFRERVLEVRVERGITRAQALTWLENRGIRMDIDKERI